MEAQQPTRLVKTQSNFTNPEPAQCHTIVGWTLGTRRGTSRRGLRGYDTIATLGNTSAILALRSVPFQALEAGNSQKSPCHRTLKVAQSTASPLASRFMTPLCCSQAARIRPQSLLNLGRGLIWNLTVTPGSPPNADGCKPGRRARQADQPHHITISKTNSPSATAIATRQRDWIYMATMHAFSSTEISHREK